MPDFDDPIPLETLLSRSHVLPRRFYVRPTTEVARELLGKIVIFGPCAGRIVEVEAYLGERDAASHAFRGLTPRTRVMFGAPGHAYVYISYGMHDCLNFVTEPEGTAGAVLIRALEPLCGLAGMHARRAIASTPRQLASGPGKLTRAMGITRRENGLDLTGSSPLTVHRLDDAPALETVTTTRIGINVCTDWPLRFYIAGSRYISRK